MDRNIDLGLLVNRVELNEGIFEVYLERFLKELRRISNTPKFRKFLLKLHKMSLQKDGVEERNNIILENISDIESNIRYILECLGKDRYKNIKIDYMKQKLEKYLGDLVAVGSFYNGFTLNECCKFFRRIDAVRGLFEGSRGGFIIESVSKLINTDRDVVYECMNILGRKFVVENLLGIMSLYRNNYKIYKEVKELIEEINGTTNNI